MSKPNPRLNEGRVSEIEVIRSEKLGELAASDPIGVGVAGAAPQALLNTNVEGGMAGTGRDR